MQLEIGMSTRRYLPASGTAGLARSLVSGKRRVPWPPPMITERTLLVFTDCRPVRDDIVRLRGCSIPMRAPYRPFTQRSKALVQHGQPSVVWWSRPGRFFTLLEFGDLLRRLRVTTSTSATGRLTGFV